MLHGEDDSESFLVRGAGALRKIGLIGVALAAHLLFFNNSVPTVEAADLDIWWPAEGVEVEGVQPFKFSLSDSDVESYDAFWQVGNGSLNKMDSSYRTYPHKEASVDLTNWTWRKDDTYSITFIAKEKNGDEIAQEFVEIHVEGSNADSEESLNELDEEEQEASVEKNETSEEASNIEDSSSKAEEEEAEEANTEHSDGEVNTSLVLEWPQDRAKLTGVQTFTTRIEGAESNVEAFWQVGNGSLNRMSTSGDGSVTAEADVDLTNWTWREDGEYTLTFFADLGDGETLRETIKIVVEEDAWNESNLEEATEPEFSESSESSVPAGDNPLAGKVFYRAPNSNASKQADEWRNSRPDDAKLMDIMAGEPQSMWIGGWGNTESDVRNRVRAAQSAGQIAVFVAYNIPYRDCGLYSAGGARNGHNYREWIAGVARGLEGSGSVVILEPDALAGADCLNDSDKAERKQLIRDAIVTLKEAGAIVYVEASSPPWKSPEEMAKRLKEIGVENADGFAMNTSSYTATNLSVGYGEEISRRLGGMHFLVDTSRSGRGQTEDQEWCNPSGRGLGPRPTTNTGNELVDAFLWVKAPGESDGTCNGGPRAGQWYPEQALELVKNRAF